MKFKLKQGYGSHRAGGVTYRSGDIIDTTREELGGAIDKFEAMETDPPPPEPTAVLYMVEGKEGYDVVNSTSGIKLNDVPLTLAEAEAMGAIVEHDSADPDEDDKEAHE